MKKSYKIHKWAGLISALFLLLIGLSGAILVFNKEIDEIQFPELYSIDNPNRTIELDAAILLIEKKYPFNKVRVKQFTDPHQAIAFEIRDKVNRRMVYIHPVTSKILLNVDADSIISRWLLKLHYTLHAGEIGKFVVFLVGLLFVLSIITGFVVYKKSILKVILFKEKFRTKNVVTFSSSLHRIVGVWSLLFNFILGFTGLLISLTIVVSGLKPKKNNLNELHKSKNSVKVLLNSITLKYPNYTPSFLILPTKPNTKLKVFGKVEDDFALYSIFGNQIEVDIISKKIVSAEFNTTIGFGKRFYGIVLSTHFGEFGGMFIKILYFFIGLTPPLLSITGFILWKRKKINRKKKIFRLKLS
jgi:uncharacterized iron-regulated membrane protein